MGKLLVVQLAALKAARREHAMAVSWAEPLAAWMAGLMAKQMAVW